MSFVFVEFLLLSVTFSCL